MSASKRIFERLCEVIPGGVNSPVRACTGIIDPPLIVERGEGDSIYDADGKRYIDYCCSWGALIHGHAHPRILEAVSKRMSLGTSFGIATEIEEKLARAIVDRIESIEKIRFVSSGTEAAMSAARLARGFTGRPLIVKFNGNYHGHADFFLVNAGSGVLSLQHASSQGIPQEIVRHTASLPYNDRDAARRFLQEHAKEIAGVILEPIAGNMGVVPASRDFIRMLREETAKGGSLLIFDEVITGFRVGPQGAQALYAVKPDLTCFGKIVGGGFPAAAFGGRKEIMDCLAPLGAVYQAGTLSGNPVAMEAGYQALRLLDVPGFYEELQRKAEIITKPVQEHIEEKGIAACIQQQGSMFTLFLGKKAVNDSDDAKATDGEAYRALFRYLYERGVYVPPLQQEAWFVSAVHTETHLEQTRDLLISFLS